MSWRVRPVDQCKYASLARSPADRLNRHTQRRWRGDMADENDLRARRGAKGTVIEEYHAGIEQEKVFKGHKVTAGSLFPVDHDQPKDTHQDAKQIDGRQLLLEKQKPDGD